jgi:hypothetical protein
VRGAVVLLRQLLFPLYHFAGEANIVDKKRTIVGPERRLLTRFRHSHWPTWKSAENAKLAS